MVGPGLAPRVCALGVGGSVRACVPACATRGAALKLVALVPLPLRLVSSNLQAMWQKKLCRLTQETPGWLRLRVHIVSCATG